MSLTKKSLRIGELLVQKGVVSPDQVRIALTEQKRNRDHLGKILVRLGFATEAVILDVLGGALGQQKADLNKVVVDSEAIRMIPKDLARRFHILPLTFEANRRRLTIAMADTFNVVALDQIVGGIILNLLAAGLTVAEVSEPRAGLSVASAVTVHVLLPVDDLPRVLSALAADGSVEVVLVPGSDG